MPQEIFWIVIVAILAGTFSGVVKTVIGYLQSNPGKSDPKGSLTESQLRSLIESSVEQSIAPLAGRLDSIDRHLDRALEAPPDRPRLSAREDFSGPE